MAADELCAAIEALWEERDTLAPGTSGEAREAILATLDALDRGVLRVAEKTTAGWRVHQWLKKAVLLSFRLTDMAPMPGGRRRAGGTTRCRRNSRAGARTASREAGFRAVPGAWCGAPPISRPASC